MAILLQSLCVRLGLCTGLDLAQSCTKYFPRWVSLILYVLCEIAIMATDLAEVIGSAIALQLLFGIPLLYGVLITGLDVFLILIIGFNAKHMRYFEFFIATLVLVTATCLFIVAGKSKPNWSDLFLGILPSTRIITDPGSVYVAVGIIGATVMPHNLYLHSSIVKYRRHNADGVIGEDMDVEDEIDTASMESNGTLQPLRRKKVLTTTLQMSHLDSIFALCFALLVNASILVIAAANFYSIGKTDVAEIGDAYRLIGIYLGPGFATLFAVALLLAGQGNFVY